MPRDLFYRFVIKVEHDTSGSISCKLKTDLSNDILASTINTKGEEKTGTMVISSP